MADESTIDDGGNDGELRLARAVRDLVRDVQPVRDLWPGIEGGMARYPQRAVDHGQRWLPWGVAASLLIATAALVLNLVRPAGLALQTVSLNGPVAQMQSEYIRVSNPLVEKFRQNNRNLDPATLDDLYRNYEILENARRELERQVHAHPGDQRLVELLMKVHEQEMDLLKRDYTQPGHYL